MSRLTHLAHGRSKSHVICDRRQYTHAWLTFLRFFLGGLDGLSMVAVLFDLSCDFDVSFVVAFCAACCCCCGCDLVVGFVSFMVPLRSCLVAKSVISTQSPSHKDARSTLFLIPALW
jgi:hypothetical protein